MSKKCLLLFPVIFLFLSTISAQEGKIDTTALNKYKLVWHDEFDYEGLPDSTKWSFEEGMFRGVQKQYYTNKRLSNANVSNGLLTITARKELYPNPQKQGFTKKYGSKYPQKYLSMPADSVPAWVRARYDSIINYTSASLTTLRIADWKFGRIEIKAKLPSGKGISCALWMLGTNAKKLSNPTFGEIDIMESVGKNPEKIHGTVHFKDSTSKQKQYGNSIQINNVSESFHIYAVDWTSDSIKISADGIVYTTFPIKKASYGGNNPFVSPFYLIMNIAIGSGAWSGPLDDSILPQKMEIDYVRVYQ